MPAKAQTRINEAGTYSHIYNRGIEKRLIFNDEEDFSVFTQYLEDYLSPKKDPESVKKSFEINGKTFKGTPHQPKNYFNQIELIAYRLTSDHFHLLVHQATQGSLEKFLRSLLTRYSMYFNKKYKRAGSLFDGPYKSISLKGDKHMAYLTYYLHKKSDRSSYLEYLGSKNTFWVKPQRVISLFKNKKEGYKYFVEKYVLDEKQKELIDSLTFNEDLECLEGRDLTSSVESASKVHHRTHSRVPHFLGLSLMVFFLLMTLGLRNISVYSSNLSSSLPKPQVLPAKTQEQTKEAYQEATPSAVLESTSSGSLKIILSVKLDDTFASANIRQEPTTESEKIGKAKKGEVFEFVSENQYWYEVRLKNGSTGFISKEYMVVKEEEDAN